MRTFTLMVYGVFGAVALVAATGGLVAPSLILSGDALSPLTAHLVREQSAGFVFIGLMFLWCARHFDQRRPVHLALLVFTTLFAAIHWADYLQNYRDIGSPLVNSVPTILLAVTAPVRREAR